MRFFSKLVGILLCLAACRSASVAPAEDLSTQLFYAGPGAFVVYDVTEQTYALSGAGVPISQVYQLKEKVASTFTDGEGQPAWRIERYRRVVAAQPWHLDSVWTAKQTRDKAIKIENNQAFVKLIFPLQDGLRWNANQYNNQGRDDYEMQRVGLDFGVGRQTYPRTVTVLQQNDSTLVGNNRRIEVFAAGIGLIYKEKTDFTYCANSDCLGRGRVDFGSRVLYRIQSFGKE
jgi:hypothetical protein